MQNLNKIKQTISDINPDYLQLCGNFLILYSRFEYALKEVGCVRDSSKAMASLNDFAIRISAKFNSDSNKQLAVAVRFILHEPPMVQYNHEGKLVWESATIGGSEVEQLCEYIRRVRNHLMHGGKFYGQIATDARNWKLITSSMIVIEYWIDLDEEVKECFHNFEK